MLKKLWAKLAESSIAAKVTAAVVIVAVLSGGIIYGLNQYTDIPAVVDPQQGQQQEQQEQQPDDDILDVEDIEKDKNGIKKVVASIVDTITGTDESDKNDEKPVIRYVVKFETNGGGEISDKSVVSGTRIDKLPTPKRDGNIFLGWYYDKDLTEAVKLDDKVNKNMTLYASWLEQTPLETLERVNFAAAENVGKDFTVKVLSSDSSMTADDVKAALIAQNLTNPAVTDFIKVTAEGNGFVIRGVKHSEGMGTSAGFEEGATYTIRLDSEALTFDGQDASVREFNFTTKKEEILNLKLNGDMIYIPASDLHNIINDGQAVSTLNIALYNVRNDGGISAAELKEGTFEYTKGTLSVGQLVSVYDGLIPTERTLETPEDQLGDIGYVEITAVNGNKYSFRSAQAEEVIFTPDMLPMPVGVDLDEDAATLTVEDKYFDYSADIYFEMDLDSQTKVDVGDYFVFYTGDLAVTSGENAAERTGFAEITAVTKNADGTTTVAYKDVSWDEVDSSMDVYTQDEVTAEEMLEGINKEDIEAAIEQQAIDSGFAEEAAQYLASLAFATDNFTALSDNMNLEDYKVTLTDGTPVSPEQLNLMDNGISAQNADTKVKASVSKKPSHLGNVAGTNADKEGLAITLEVTSVITIDSADEEGELEITVTGKFVEEIGFDYGASSDTEWSWWGIIPYISEWTVSANVDLINYTGLEITATMITKEAEDDDILSDGENIAEQIKEILESTTNPETGDDNQNGLIEKYSKMVHADSDWIRIVEINIFELDKRLPPMLPIIHVEFSVDFVIEMEASVAVGFEFNYLEGTRYIFNVRITEGSVTNSRVTLQEKTYDLCFYTMGRVAVKAGVELEFKIGLFSTKLANVGFDAGAGPYTKLWGYFYYELKYTESQGRSQNYSGALLTEVGVYFHLGLGAEALGGRYSSSVDLVDKEWLLWQAGRRDNVLDFVTEQEDMPEVIMRQYVRRMQLPDSIFNMLYLDLITGDGKNAIYNDWNDPSREGDFRNGANYQITITNDKFTYDPKTNEIVVSVEEDDIKVEGEMIITWKKQPMSFSSKPLQRRIKLYWDNLRDGYMIVPYTNGGTYVPMIVKGYDQKITAPADPEKTGYTFAGWYSDEALTVPYTFPERMPNTDTNVYAKWEARTDIPYTVEYYKENLQSGEYELFETEILEGTTDTYVTPVVKDYEGYIAPSEQEIKVWADGSATLRYYYKLHRNTVTFIDGFDGEENSTYSLKYGARITPPVMTAKGYSFAGWSLTDGDGTIVLPESLMGTQPLSYTATWQKNPDTEYRVEYYVQQTDGSYKLQHLFTEQAFTDTVITEAALRAVLIDGVPADEKFTDGAGITAENMTVRGIVCEDGTAKVTGDGKLVIKINYARTLSTLKFDSNGGTPTTEKAVYYKQTVEKPADPTRTGYTFAGWDDLATEAIEAVSPLTVMGAEDVTYKAMWVQNNYTVRFNKADDLAEGEMEAQGFTYDAEKQPLTANAFTKTYYDFAGWATQAGGSIAYANEEAVSNLTAASGGIVDLYAVWTPTNYSITYNNTEKATHTNPAQYNTETATFALIPAVRTGYIFDGWFADAEFTGEAVTEITLGSGGNVELFAKWIARTDIPYKAEHYTQHLDGSWILADTDSYTGTSDTTVTPDVNSYTGFATPTAQTVNVEADGSTVVRYEYNRNSYTLNFNTNGGQLAEGEPESITAQYESPITLPKTADREGYGFAGWFNGDDKFEAATMPAENLDITAKWEAGKYTYTVNHHKQNVDGNGYTVETEIFTADMDQEVTPEIKTYEGFTSPTETKTIKIGTDVSENTVTYEYTRNQYDLVWDLNGGTAEGYTDGKVYYGAQITAPVPSKTGYSYTWDKAPAATMPAENLAYTANWTANSYTVSFDLAGGTVENGDASPRTVVFDTAYGQLPTLAKTGYTFKGWFTAAEGGTEITAETVLSTAADHTIYAQYDLVTYSITYVDEIDGTHTNTAEYSVLTNGITISDAVKTGYTFLGWYENGEKVTVISAGTVGNRTLTASWHEHAYTVVFHSNNGQDDTTSQTFAYSENKALNAKPENFAKDGFEFAGWATSPAGEKVYENGQNVGQLAQADNAVVNLYAVWNEITYDISYVFVNGDKAVDSPDRILTDVTNGSANGTNPTSYSYSNNFNPLYAPTKAGYKFEGWYLDPALANKLELPTSGLLTFADYSDQTLYAKMVPNQYRIAFYQGTENESPATKTVLFDETVSLSYYSTNISANKAGYTLLGWSTDKNSTTAQYGINDSVAGLATEDGVTANLYAVWQLNVYTISYNMGAHTTSTADAYVKEYSIETPADITLPTPAAKTNFRFGGWYTDAAYTTKISTISKLDTTNYTLYAKWEHAGEFSIAYTGKTNGKAIFTITRTIPGGAVGTQDIQNVYVRTLNGTAYATTPEVATGTGQDKYHFTHNQVVFAFTSDMTTATFEVTEKDDYLANYVTASYRIGEVARNYHAVIYKVENNTGGLAGTVGTGKATRTMAKSSYVLTNNMYRAFTKDVITEAFIANLLGKNYTETPADIFNASATEAEKAYREITADQFGYRVTADMYARSFISPDIRFYTVTPEGNQYERCNYSFSSIDTFKTQSIVLPTNGKKILTYCTITENLTGCTLYDRGGKTYVGLSSKNSVKMIFCGDSTKYSNVKMDVVMLDTNAPAAQYVAPLAITDYKKGDEVYLTVIYNEPINSISGTPSLALSSRLSTYFENPTYVNNGTGTNAVVFKVKAKTDISADTVQNLINQYLAFPESKTYKADGFSTNIGTISATVKDLFGN